MTEIATNIRRCSQRNLSKLLDARISVGHQFGVPVVVTVRQVLRQTPCLLLMGALVIVALLV